MKNLFRKKSETNWNGIYFQFQQSIQKKCKKTASFADYKRIKKASETPMDYLSTRWITRFYFSWYVVSTILNLKKKRKILF